MRRYEIKSKNVLTEPIISPKVDRFLVFIFAFLGSTAGVTLKSVTEWSYWLIILFIILMALILICLIKLIRSVWLKVKEKNEKIQP